MEKEVTLQVQDLELWFDNDRGSVKILNGISFDIYKGETLGIVGESGCGKSVTSLSIMRLLQSPPARFGGSIKLQDKELLKLSERQMQAIRGNRISMIFQEPMTSLNPVFTIGDQLIETFMQHQGLSKAEAWAKGIEMLRMVRIPLPEQRMKEFPYQLSGGMRQRVMIAMALACQPELLIADEPTTALDVTIQAQVLDLMRDLQKELGMAIIMITHDLGVVAQMCDEVIVMYAGSICEQGSADEIFYNPKHEYTKGLMRSIPTLDNDGQRLQPISGTPIDLLNMPEGCPFAPRCDAAMKICLRERCERMQINDMHQAGCWMNVKEAMEKEGGETDA